MSGHSKWSTIKRKKGKADAERGKLFSKIIKELTVAARAGGGDPDGNPRLRAAIDAARSGNMPAANIDKAIKRGTGELPGITYEEHSYEGYGPQGVAILIEVLTDNKNRTTSEIRHLLSKNGGHLGEVGCVSWMFDLKGSIEVEKGKVDEDELMTVALDAGAEDVKTENDFFEVVTTSGDLEKVRSALVEKGMPLVRAQLTRNPQTVIALEGKPAEQVLRLMDALDVHDDVQKVYANFDVPDEIIESLGGE
ncbi:MAG: YebC/PmpR family DNA-binding transcriptional regulator [Candidatus Eisenbacteria bacterium]